MNQTAILLLFFGSTTFAANNCRDNEVFNLDIKNIELSTKVGVSEQLQFRNGVATTKVDEHQKAPEWEYTIKKDERASPLPGVKLRVLTINKNHLQGSGNYNLFAAITCEHGQLKTVWPATEINFLKVTDKKITYETIGEYRGVQGYAPGKIVILEWNQDRKELVEKVQ